jgi:hypothetical protein
MGTNATIVDQGNYERTFDVTIYANQTIIATVENINFTGADSVENINLTSHHFCLEHHVLCQRSRALGFVGHILARMRVPNLAKNGFYSLLLGI